VESVFELELFLCNCLINLFTLLKLRCRVFIQYSNTKYLRGTVRFPVLLNIFWILDIFLAFHFLTCCGGRYSTSLLITVNTVKIAYTLPHYVQCVFCTVFFKIGFIFLLLLRFTIIIISVFVLYLLTRRTLLK